MTNKTKGYWKLKEKTLDRNLWRTRFGRGYGHSVIQNTDLMKVLKLEVTEVNNALA